MSRNRFGFLERHGHRYPVNAFLGVRSLVAVLPMLDLLAFAKHLFVAAKTVWRGRS